MTERRPPGVRFESWIERQIRDAQRAGLFDDLSGAGRPLPDLDRPHDDLWWIKQKLQREDVGFTPQSIAVRIERDRALEDIARARSEQEVRGIVERINERIAYVNSHPGSGPPSTIVVLEVEEVLERWRETAPPPDRTVPAPVEEQVVSTRRGRRPRFLRRRGRSDQGRR